MNILLIMILTQQAHPVFGQVPSAGVAESIQLQQLINKSEEQIIVLKKLLGHKKQDSESLQKASRILEEMSLGIDESIKKYQGTKIYEKALLDLQAKDDYNQTYSDSQQVRRLLLADKNLQKLHEQNDKNLKNVIKFQKESVRANHSDLEKQKNLTQALQTSGPGFLPKIQTQVELGNWQANTRISAQLTELLAAIHAMREELRILRLQQGPSSALSILVNGSDIQNQKLKEAKKP